MNRLLMAKKGTKPGIYVTFCIIFAIFGGVGLLSSDGPLSLLGGSFSVRRLPAMLAPVFCILAAVFSGVTAGQYAKSYLNIYDDRIEGYGLLNKGSMRAQSFNVPRHLCQVTSEGSAYVCVRCNGAQYYLYFEKADVAPIMACANGSSYTYTAPEPVILTCPTCGTRCRIPAGKGKIKVKCPKCRNQFEGRT